MAAASWQMPAVGYAMQSAGANSYRFLSKEQAQTVKAIAAQLVPEDEFPGAGGPVAVDYIDGVLAGAYGKFYKTRYVEGLKATDAISQKNFQRDFSALNGEQQIGILKKLESGEGVGDSGKQFFQLILLHTFEAYYGGAHHDASGENASWKMLGFEG